MERYLPVILVVLNKSRGSNGFTELYSGRLIKNNTLLQTDMPVLIRVYGLFLNSWIQKMLIYIKI